MLPTLPETAVAAEPKNVSVAPDAISTVAFVMREPMRNVPSATLIVPSNASVSASEAMESVPAPDFFTIPDVFVVTEEMLAHDEVLSPTSNASVALSSTISIPPVET